MAPGLMGGLFKVHDIRREGDPLTRFCSIFSQLLQLLPAHGFSEGGRRTSAALATKGFGYCDQFVAMLFCQLGRAYSLRGSAAGSRAARQLAHLGAEAPARSSLAYANAHRPWQLYQHVFY